MQGDRQVQLLGEALRRVPDGTLLERVVSAAAPMLMVSGVAAALMTDEDGGGVVASSSDVGRDLLELAFQLGEGPSRDSFRGDSEVLVDDLALDGANRWPVFSHAAQELGVAAVYAFPARLGAIRIGGLLVHHDRAGSLDHTCLTDARVFAELCSTLMVDHQAGLNSDAVMATGWPTRAGVHQATGMVSVQLETSLSTALARLRAYAYAEERFLEDVARDVVERRLRLAP